MRKLLSVALLCLGMTSAQAAIDAYTNQASFQAALDGEFTLVNLDAAPLLFAAPYRVEDTAPAAAFLALGIDFINFNAQVDDGQNAQTPGNRDQLIFNGTGLSPGGTVALNFLSAVNGVGAWSNNLDGGRVRAFTGPNLGGTFLGEVPFGPGSFGGLTSDTPIGSVQFTCTFN